MCFERFLPITIIEKKKNFSDAGVSVYWLIHIKCSEPNNKVVFPCIFLVFLSRFLSGYNQKKTRLYFPLRRCIALFETGKT